MANCKPNRKQEKEIKHQKVLTHLDNDHELCRGDRVCCGKLKPLSEFSPSALKCICKNCSKKIREINRQNKIDDNEDYYIYEKIRNTLHRVSIFTSILKCSKQFFCEWIKSQSTDPFNEHFDHVLPIHFFKRFSDASKFTALRDSWINFRPCPATENLSKHTTVDFSLFETQLDKAHYFLNRYKFESEAEKKDMFENFNFIDKIFSLINERTRTR